MIRLDLSTLVLVTLLLMLGPIFVAWLVNEYRRGKRERAVFEHVIHCRLCGFDFGDQNQDALAKCPRCGSLNERFPVRRL